MYSVRPIHCSKLYGQSNLLKRSPEIQYAKSSVDERKLTRNICWILVFIKPAEVWLLVNNVPLETLLSKRSRSSTCIDRDAEDVGVGFASPVQFISIVTASEENEDDEHQDLIRTCTSCGWVRNHAVQWTVWKTTFSSWKYVLSFPDVLPKKITVLPGRRPFHNYFFCLLIRTR